MLADSLLVGVIHYFVRSVGLDSLMTSVKSALESGSTKLTVVGMTTLLSA